MKNKIIFYFVLIILLFILPIFLLGMVVSFQWKEYTFLHECILIIIHNIKFFICTVVGDIFFNTF
ncbi:hypothetical protein ACIPUQ_20425 [Pectobacterium carotovorum]